MKVSNTSHNQNLSAIFAILTALLAGVWVWYIFQVNPVLPMHDQYPLLEEFQKFKKDGFSFALLWDSKGGHVYPGYKLTFFLNSSFFGFSPKLEIFVSILAFAAAVFFIVRSFASELKLPAIIVILFGLAVILLFMNWQTVNLSTYSLIAARLMNFSLFVLTSVMCFNFLSASKMDGKKFSIRGGIFFGVLCVSILFFGRGWGMAATFAMVALTGLHFLSNWIQKGDIKINQHVFILVSLLIILPVYFARLEVGGDGPMDIMKASGFALTKFGHAGLRMFGSELDQSIPATWTASILFLFLTAFFSLNYLFRAKITKGVWLALFLVYFSILATLLVTANRYTGSPFFPRHNMETSMGWVGMLFLIVKFLDNFLKNELRLTLTALVIVFMAVPAGLASLENYNTRGFLKNYNLRVKENFIAAYTDPAGFDKKPSSMNCPRNQKTCLSYLEIMKEHGIGRAVIEEAKANPKTK